jgi:hypothetical protein
MHERLFHGDDGVVDGQQTLDLPFGDVQGRDADDP